MHACNQAGLHVCLLSHSRNCQMSSCGGSRIRALTSCQWSVIAHWRVTVQGCAQRQISLWVPNNGCSFMALAMFSRLLAACRHWSEKASLASARKCLTHFLCLQLWHLTTCGQNEYQITSTSEGAADTSAVLMIWNLWWNQKTTITTWYHFSCTQGHREGGRGFAVANSSCL